MRLGLSTVKSAHGRSGVQANMKGLRKPLFAGISLLAIVLAIAAGFYFTHSTALAGPASDGRSSNGTAVFQGDTSIVGGLGSADGTQNDTPFLPDEIEVKPFSDGTSSGPFTPPTAP